MSAPALPPLSDRAAVHAAVTAALLRDRPGLLKLWRKVSRAQDLGQPHDQNLARLTRQLAASQERLAARAASVPVLSYPPELPVCARHDELLDTLRAHQVVIVCGETGSGKSTQLPKLLLELGCGVAGAIGHTQPRRIAARAVARRVAEELSVPLGKQVGFRVRFGDETSPDTLVKLLTDGMLLAETRGDRELLAYDALILDEAHERSLNVDFLLGYLKRLLPRRPDLKLVITSATIDPERFAQHFARDGVPAPIVEVSGRTHPVELRWRPPVTPQDDESTVPDELGARVADALREACSEGPGDVLVFLPTERDIHEVRKVLEGGRFPGGALELLPLYARLSPEAQQRVFADHSGRRVVLSTNVAETSLTVPGVRFVIDTGTARLSRWSPRSRIQRLPIEPISRASADQRMGRCGRVGPGICFRLYDEAGFQKRDERSTPEIQRSNLASVVLGMADLGLGAVADFPFLDPPRKSMVEDGVATLRELSALDHNGQLTEVGRTLARLPVDPRVGRMLLSAHETDCLADLLIIASFLESADPRERPPGQEKAARSAHGKLLDGDSDFMSSLTLWDHVHALRQDKSRSQWQAALKAQFLSPARVREWIDVHGQLRQLVAEAGLRPGRRSGDRHTIQRALLSGLIAFVACLKDNLEYQGADGRPLWLWPGSALFEKRPRWIVAAEIVETSRRFARTVAKVDPGLIEELAGPLLERSYHDPWWDRPSGQVLAHEKISLHGLPLVPRRRARYDRVEPVICRELFIRHGLAEGQLETDAPFLKHNLALANEIAALEARTRRRGLLADLDARYDFYDRLLPAEASGATAFHHWRKGVERKDRQLLFMDRADLLRQDPGEAAHMAHPDELLAGGISLPLRYKLEPGADDDGVTATVLVADLPRIDERAIEWLVPGLLREKVLQLLRCLPKELRRELSPIATRVDEVLVLLERREGGLLAALARAVQRVVGRPVSVSHFDRTRLPEALQLRLEVVDESGRTVAVGRDLAALREELGARAARAEAAIVDPRFAQDGLTRWDFGALPQSVGLADGRRAYPALLDRNASVSLRLLANEREAAEATRAGMGRLLCLSVGGAIVHRLQRRAEWQTLLLHAASFDHGPALREGLVARAVEDAFLKDPASADVRDAERYGALLAAGRDRIPAVLELALPPLARALAAGHAARLELQELSGTPLSPLAAPLLERLDQLLSPSAVAGTSSERLAHLPRYVEAVARRLLRVRQRGTVRDAELAARVAPWEVVLAELQAECAARGQNPAALDALRWLLEEYRVSVFAQELGTDGKVSAKRLAAAADAVRAALAR